MDAKLEYNISSKIAELVKNFPQEFDYLQIAFVSKTKNYTCQDTFFISKNGKFMNGGKNGKK